MELHRTEHVRSPSGQLVEVRYLGVSPHAGELRNVVLNLKYHGQRRNAQVLAQVVVAALRDCGSLPTSSVVTWAPTTPKRIRSRGFDHAELIARHVAAELRVPVRRLLRRTNQESQTGHTRTERLRKVEFIARRVTGMEVLLIDDVITTGATMRFAAHELVRSGAVKVTCIAPSRTMEEKFS